MICVSELSFAALAAVLGMEGEKKSDAVLEEATRRLKPVAGIDDLLEPYGEVFQTLVDMAGMVEPGNMPSTGDYVERRNRIFKIIREAYRRGLEAKK
jgi:hypothetical protein